MPTIDWLKAGSAAKNSASSIVNDFRGRILCDSEIVGEAEGVEGVTKEEFIAFTRTAIHNDLLKLDSGMWTRTDPVVKSNQQFVDGCYSYSATVIAFKTDAGDRIEHWEGGTSDDGQEAMACAVFYKHPRGRFLLLVALLVIPSCAAISLILGIVMDLRTL